MAEFVHLHVHSNYSILDGLIKVGDLVKRTAKYGMKSVALTDHGVMFGLADFYKQAIKAKIKPILGVETYVTLSDPLEKKRADHRHLVLLAKNYKGYENIVKLVSLANIEGFYYEPCVTKKQLAENCEGIIALSACLSGEIPRAIVENRDKDAYDAAVFYKDLFGDDFYLELQKNGLKDQEKANFGLIELSKRLGIKCVATCDAHYLERHEAVAQDIMFCISAQTTLDDKDRFHSDTDEIYFKTPDEMAAAFAEWPWAIENTLEVDSKIERFSILRPKHILPKFPAPDGETEESYLRRKATEGLNYRLANKTSNLPDSDYWQRLEYELSVIISMGFAGYYLIVADFINWAKENGIFVGPGRGSGAGSLVAYALKITNTDPLKYSLLFERFLNKDRVSMPDFDVDFASNRRDEVIDYVSRKYGKENVVGVVTFQTLQARAAVRNVAKVVGKTPSYADSLASLIPTKFNLTPEEKEQYKGKPALDIALDKEPKFKAKYDEDPDAKKIIDFARMLEGAPRQTGKHPGGTVIAPETVYNLAPVFIDRDQKQWVVQYSKDVIDDVGLVKFDLLGLKTLTIIQTALELINERRAKEGLLPVGDKELYGFDDAKVFSIYVKGDTDNVFQSESDGFKSMLRDIHCDCLEDLIAAVSLYRPGPMSFIPTLAKRKAGLEPIEYDMPEFEPILKETYGIIVYQEQVMQIASAAAGFSLGQADILRRAMGKKKPEEMTLMRAGFIEGAGKKGISAEKAGEIFDKIEKFAGYGFNKSHAAAYAVLSYQTAWLKVHYPTEFMAAVLTVDSENIDTVIKDIAAAINMGLTILPPCVNSSYSTFSAEGAAVRFGLSAVRGAGKGAMDAIIEERERGGKFKDLFEFCERVDLRKVNKGALEALIKAGAFDFSGVARGAMAAVLEKAINAGANKQKNAKAGLKSMFELPSAVANGAAIAQITYPDVSWTQKERLTFEKESLGFYLSGHPLDAYSDILPKLISHNGAMIAALNESRDEVTIAGVLLNVEDRPTKSGKGRYARGIIDMKDHRVKFMLFGKAYESCLEAIEKTDEPLLISGSVEVEEKEIAGGEDEETTTVTDITFRPEKMEPLANIRRKSSRKLVISLPGDVKEQTLKKIRDMLRGSCTSDAQCSRVSLVFKDLHKEARVYANLPPFFKIAADENLIEELRKLVGRDAVYTE